MVEVHSDGTAAGPTACNRPRSSVSVDDPAPGTINPARRDTSADGWVNTLRAFALSHGAPFWNSVEHIRPLRRTLNRALINKAILAVPPRPYPLSTMAAYTSWPSLTDRTFDGRHLPPTRPPADLPSSDSVTALFGREKFTPCPKSTVLFAYFAQWFTDGFLRSDRTAPPDPRKNTSNHQIDLCQVYGLTESVTRLLRAGDDGLLKSQRLNGEEYPPFLCHQGEVAEEFRGLTVVGFDHLAIPQRDTLFALGGDRANSQIGYTAISVLFLREHNRIARLLAAEYPRWDDERLFQTTRNILTVILLRIVIDEYINHITPYHFRFRLDPRAARGRWHRQNWMAIEFNLLYRWHSLIPSTLRVGAEEHPIERTTFANDLLIEHGVAGVLLDASGQRAGRIGLQNTAAPLVHLERAGIEQARAVQIAPYNNYREYCGFPRTTSFAQITGDAAVQARLYDLYGSVDRLEYFVGIFAEDLRPYSILPPLIGRLVGTDAFSQALTNPLLAPRIYNERTFSRLGMTELSRPCTLSDLVRRNSGPTQMAALNSRPITMTRSGWRR
ncbi:peroxidase family protein [Cryptosporangium sp. NPDC051539]|uniref:peroxidase family protein n=1 Tax=Cryptosporangium sp. NPDC051539 TaxID=3363962 RepID=UPI0037B597D1